MYLNRRALSLAAAPLLLSATLTAPTTSLAVSASITPLHLYWAERLLQTVQPQHNVYGSHPSYIWWQGVHDKTYSANRTVCSSLITHLFMQAYNFTPAYFRTWLRSPEPLASRYYTAIVGQSRFQHITDIADVQAGDVIAIRYDDHGIPEDDGKVPPSGHMLLVAKVPTPRPSTAPIVSSTTQYDVTIIDSTGSTHGPTDTRQPVKGQRRTGVGQGIFRLYADSRGRIAGYTWSDAATGTAGRYYSVSSIRHIAVGRFTGGH